MSGKIGNGSEVLEWDGNDTTVTGWNGNNNSQSCSRLAQTITKNEANSLQISESESGWLRE